MRGLKWLVVFLLSGVATGAFAFLYDVPVQEPTLYSGLMSFVGFLRGTMRSVTVIAGSCMLMMSVLQFKRHRDNPAEMPISTPVSLALIALALLGITYIPIQYG